MPNLLLLIAPGKLSAATAPTEVFAPIKDRDPYAYVIGVILLLGLSALMVFLRILWTKNEKLQEEKDALHESKMQFALDAAATMKEAVGIVQKVHDKMEPMIQGNQERRDFQKDLMLRIESMEQSIVTRLEHMKD